MNSAQRVPQPPIESRNEMSEAEATRFLDDLETDAEFRSLMEEFRDRPEKAYLEVIERGYSCTAEEIKFAMMERLSPFLEDDQLDQVNAGLSKKASDAIVISVFASSMVVIGVASAAAAI